MTTKKHGEISYKETSYGIIPRSELIPLEIEGIKKAWDFVFRKHKQGTIPISTSFLKKVHNIGFGWIFPDMGGKFRRIEVTVSKHNPPKFYQIPTLMEDFIKDMKTRIKHLPNLGNDTFLQELTSLLAWSHHRFLWIHPFTDYNGRIARLLNNIILLNLNLPPAELHVETETGRKNYVNALKEADKGVYKKLEKIIQTALAEAAKELTKEKNSPK